jgi:hypothetical protein
MKTAVDFMASELLYLDNEYDMKLINKNEYQAKRKEIIDQANKMFEEQIKNAWIDGVTNWDSEKEVEDYINETFKSE